MLGFIIAAVIAAPVLIEGSLIFNEDDYPLNARAAGVVGDVWYRLEIDSKGVATGCRILQGTWSPDIDKVVCAVVRKRARFYPSRDASGTAVNGRYDGYTNFNLSGGVPRPNAGHVVHVAFDAEGIVTDCIVKPVAPNAYMPADVHEKCDRQGNAAVFSSFLARPTKGLRWAEIRTFQLPEAKSYTNSGYSFRNVIGEAEYETLPSGDVTQCRSLRGAEASVAPISRIDLCELGGLIPTAEANGRKVVKRSLIIDAVAK